MTTDDSSEGAAISIQDYNPLVVNHCTFFGNDSTVYSSIAHRGDDSEFDLANSIFWRKDGAQSTPQVPVSAIVEYSVVSAEDNAIFGPGIIREDPRIRAPENFDYRLDHDSPCIDAGDSRRSPDVDIVGSPRVDIVESPNTGVGPPWSDLGAYEFVGTGGMR